jgi:hypothetical protein
LYFLRYLAVSSLFYCFFDFTQITITSFLSLYTNHNHVVSFTLHISQSRLHVSVSNIRCRMSINQTLSYPLPSPLPHTHRHRQYTAIHPTMQSNRLRGRKPYDRPGTYPTQQEPGGTSPRQDFHGQSGHDVGGSMAYCLCTPAFAINSYRLQEILLTSTVGRVIKHRSAFRARSSVSTLQPPYNTHILDC